MLIDLNILRGLVQDLGPEALGTLLALFQDDATQTVGKLEAIQGSLDDQALALEAHTLKSVAATYGAVEVLNLAREIDASCKKKIPAKEQIEQLKSLIEALKGTITEMSRIDVNALL